MKNVYVKLAKARELIKQQDMKPAGLNKFSKYTYFKPSQVETIVFEACKKFELMTKFDLLRNELGAYGTLSIIDLETGEIATYNMATAIPEITATNLAQQLGGCVTYTERYLKMTAFGIIENDLDSDHDNGLHKDSPLRKQETKKNAETAQDPKVLPELVPDTVKWEEVKHNLIYGYETKEGIHKEVTMLDVKKKFTISPENEALLISQLTETI
jgi:hypothetical protein